MGISQPSSTTSPSPPHLLQHQNNFQNCGCIDALPTYWHRAVIAPLQIIIWFNFDIFSDLRMTTGKNKVSSRLILYFHINVSCSRDFYVLFHHFTISSSIKLFILNGGTIYAITLCGELRIGTLHRLATFPAKQCLYYILFIRLFMNPGDDDLKKRCCVILCTMHL